jgi:hypothetical protein
MNGWMNTTGRPVILGANGYTFCVAPMPDIPYDITLDIIESTPFSFLGDVPIGQEELDSVMGFAHHLGTFKEAGQEFQATDRLRKNFVESAMLMNAKLRAISIFKDFVQSSGRLEEIQRPRLESQAESVKNE